MRITERQLRQMIRDEAAALREGQDDAPRGFPPDFEEYIFRVMESVQDARETDAVAAARAVVARIEHVLVDRFVNRAIRRRTFSIDDPDFAGRTR